MPVTPSYPGVYIEEVPSGVRTITGVATSITAFLGRAPEGPVDEPVTINSFGDFQRRFGGLAADYPMSYAVRDFYQNGGSQAIVVRLFKKPAAGDGIAKLAVGAAKLQAASPGLWGNALCVKVDRDGIDDDVAERFGLDAADLFNLTVLQGFKDKEVKREVFRNVSVSNEGGSRRLDRVLAQGSTLVQIQEGAVPFPANATPPDKTADDEDPTNLDNKEQDITFFAGGKDSGDGKNGGNLDLAAYKGKEDEKTGLYALQKADLFNLLCIPPDVRDEDTDAKVYQAALPFCVQRRAMLIVDPPNAWTATNLPSDSSALGLSGTDARNAAVFFSRVKQSDSEREGQEDLFVPCGIIAGVMARTDAQRGVWKAPAGIDAALNGVQGLAVNLTDAENGQLNPVGINCLRTFPIYGHVLWGSRTMRGADQIGDEYKYIPVRRMALFLEESLYRGTKWVVFEPNDEPLWSQIRLNIGAFLHSLFRQGAFAGLTPRDAYFVKCDKETTTQDDVNRGIVNILVGFAPLKPAEFVIIKIQQISRPLAT